MNEECGTEIIECSRCGMILNGKSLWITSSKTPEVLCEECYAKNENHEDESLGEE